MVTKLQAYQSALDALNSVWNSISEAADEWSRSPKMRAGVASSAVQTAINNAIKGITQNIGVLDVPEKKTRAILGNIAAKLENFRDALTAEDISNAIELVKFWKKAVEGIMGDVAEQIPEIAITPLYRGLAKKLAA